jgi:hypothetical protein
MEKPTQCIRRACRNEQFCLSKLKAASSTHQDVIALLGAHTAHEEKTALMIAASLGFEDFVSELLKVVQHYEPSNLPTYVNILSSKVS